APAAAPPPAPRLRRAVRRAPSLQEEILYGPDLLLAHQRGGVPHAWKLGHFEIGLTRAHLGHGRRQQHFGLRAAQDQRRALHLAPDAPEIDAAHEVRTKREFVIDMA